MVGAGRLPFASANRLAISSERHLCQAELAQIYVGLLKEFAERRWI